MITELCLPQHVCIQPIPHQLVSNPLHSVSKRHHLFNCYILPFILHSFTEILLLQHIMFHHLDHLHILFSDNCYCSHLVLDNMYKWTFEIITVFTSPSTHTKFISMRLYVFPNSQNEGADGNFHVHHTRNKP